MFKILIIYIYTIRFILAEEECPYGLIKNNNDHINNKYCLGDCCIPCPAQNYFYKENNIEHDFYIINILRNISCILSLIIFIKYTIKIKKNNIMIRENKNNNIEIKKIILEKNFNIIIICLSLSIFLFSSVSFFAIKNPKDIQCKDDITSSTQSNNYLCSIQGGILVFSSFSVCVWIFVLILNFSILDVFNYFYLITNNHFNNIIIWSIPTIITFIVMSTNNISYEFSNLCLVSINNIFNMFFYPLGCIIFLAFLILISSLICIIIKCIYISAEFYIYNNEDEYEHKVIELELVKIINNIKIHWKYIIIGIISVFTFTFYWIFYYKEINNFKNVFENLLECLKNKDINICIINSKEILPPYRLMLFAEILVSIIGIWLFLLFLDINIIKINNFIKNKIRFFNKKDKNNLLDHL